ncbi:unnamed protein product [Parascedosporium putredinis]|uniref:Allantoate permease n=1 Tax=Parascedosporium putredinis TaxID=1442378 RepID=A0A9P1MBY0_9PEZI|nr:unnamed protein product [Parascedosporium putredinis]CAI8000550.1 unnamed protein product [Parascedosporium putredinis]
MSSQPLLDLDPNEGRRSSVSSGAERRHSYDTLSKPAKYAISETSVGYGSDEEFLGYGGTPNPFLLPGASEHWREVYEKSEYECRHVFDPDMTWSPAEEKRIIQKLDWHVCLWACTMFFALQVDRGNLTQAVSDNMLEDLGLNTNDYNYGNTIFLASFLVAELPPNSYPKPSDLTDGSRSKYAYGRVHRRHRTLAQLLLHVEELPIRLSYFWMTLSVTGIATSLLAFALLHMRGINGWGGWRWLFLIEGLITLSIGLASFFMMPASAVETKTWFRPRGWFNDREERIVVNRVLRDDPSKGDMHNREAITPKRLWETINDYDLWPLYAIGLVAYIPHGPPSKYLTLTLRSLGFSTFNTNLLTIPVSLFHMTNLFLVTRLSERLNERTLVSMLQPLWTLPCIAALCWWPGLVDDKWGTYVLIVTLLSYPYCHAILVAWCSRNSNNVATRTVSAALYNMSVQLGNVVDSFIYRDDDKPYYRRGNSQLLLVNVASIAVFLLTKAYYVYRNRQRDIIWNSMTQEERDDYVRNTKIVGSKRLDFRFAH